MQSLLIGCTSLLCIVKSRGSSRSEELHQSTKLATGVTCQRTLRNTGTKAIHIAPALTADNGNILIECAVLLVQILADTAGHSLGIVEGSQTRLLGDLTSGIKFCQIVKVVSKAKRSCQNSTSGMANRIAESFLFDRSRLLFVFSLGNAVVYLLGILICLRGALVVQGTKFVPLAIAPLIRRLTVGGILAVIVNYGRGGCCGQSRVGSLTQPFAQLLIPGLILFCFLLFLLVCKVLIPAVHSRLASEAGGGRVSSFLFVSPLFHRHIAGRSVACFFRSGRCLGSGVGNGLGSRGL